MACGSTRGLKTWGEIKEYAQENTIMVDWDKKTPPRLRVLWDGLRRVGLVPHAIRFDKTKRGWHVCITVTDKLHPLAIVALQFLLGSDPRREALNLARLLSEYGTPGKRRWNLLYRVKLT